MMTPFRWFLPVRSAIDHSQHDAPAVLEVRDPHDAAQRQGAVGRDELTLVEDLSIGRPVAVEAWTVVQRESRLNPGDSWSGFRPGRAKCKHHHSYDKRGNTADYGCVC